MLKAAPEARNTDELRGLLRLAYAGETIFDAARDMTWPVEQGEELHPVIQMALEETRGGRRPRPWSKRARARTAGR